MMNVLIVGATGYLGTVFTARLLDSSELGAVLLSRSSHPLYAADDRVTELIQGFDQPNLSFLNELNLGALVYLAAESSPAKCEQYVDTAWQVNHHFFKLLKQELAGRGVPAYYVSTDLVFDGLEAPDGGFVETAETKPFSVYAKTKHSSEQLFSCPSDGAVIRSSLIYGQPLPNRPGNLSWMERAMAEGETLHLFLDEWRTPVFVDDVARALLKIVLERKSGIFHAAGPSRLSRVEFGRIFAKSRGYQDVDIVECFREDVASTPTRPADVSLSTKWTQAELGLQFQAPEEALSSFSRDLL